MIREDMHFFFSCVPLVVGSGGPPLKNLKTKNAGEAISGHFAKCLKSQIYRNYAAVSEEEVPIYFFPLKCL